MASVEKPVVDIKIKDSTKNVTSKFSNKHSNVADDFNQYSSGFH